MALITVVNAASAFAEIFVQTELHQPFVPLLIVLIQALANLGVIYLSIEAQNAPPNKRN